MIFYFLKRWFFVLSLSINPAFSIDIPDHISFIEKTIQYFENMKFDRSQNFFQAEKITQFCLENTETIISEARLYTAITHSSSLTSSYEALFNHIEDFFLHSSKLSSHNGCFMLAQYICNKKLSMMEYLDLLKFIKKLEILANPIAQKTLNCRILTDHFCFESTTIYTMAVIIFCPLLFYVVYKYWK